MYRISASHAVSLPLRTHNAVLSRSNAVSNVLRASLKTSAKPLSPSGTLSVALRQPLQRSLVSHRTATTYQGANFAKSLSKEAEEAYGKEKLAAVPEQVSSSSTVHPVTGEVGLDQAEQDVDMMAGIKNDFVS